MFQTAEVPSRSFKVIGIGATNNLLLVFYCNYVSALYRTYFPKFKQIT